MTRPEPRVSVVIPFLDPPPPFFAEAVASVHAQTFGDWELLLVDDGSAPAAAAFARDHAAAHPGRVAYIEFAGHAHRGLAAARNLGLRHASGEWIAMLDADDAWVPGKLAEQLAFLECHPSARWAFGTTRYWYGWTGRERDRGWDYVTRHSAGWDGAVPVGRVLQPPALLTLLLRGVATAPSMSNVIFRRDLALATGGADETFLLYEDQTLLARFCVAAPVVLSNECWDAYRQHPGSLCARATGAAMRRARRQYAGWLVAELEQAGVTDAALWRAARREIRAARFWPVGWFVNGLMKRIGRMVPEPRTDGSGQSTERFPDAKVEVAPSGR